MFWRRGASGGEGAILRHRRKGLPTARDRDIGFLISSDRLGALPNQIAVNWANRPTAPASGSGVVDTDAVWSDDGFVDHRADLNAVNR
jgi:hypothetical protein